MTMFVEYSFYARHLTQKNGLNQRWIGSVKGKHHLASHQVTGIHT